MDQLKTQLDLAREVQERLMKLGHGRKDVEFTVEMNSDSSHAIWISAYKRNENATLYTDDSAYVFLWDTHPELVEESKRAFLDKVSEWEEKYGT